MKTFLAWWENLSTREQFTVLIGGILLSIIIFYFLLWSPFTNHIDTLKQNTLETRALLQWMQTANNQIQQLQHTSQQTATITPANLLSTVDQSTKDNKIAKYVTQLAQADNNKVAVNFATIPFDVMVKWLTQLWEHDQIQVDQITIQPKGEGLVQAQVILKGSLG